MPDIILYKCKSINTKLKSINRRHGYRRVSIDNPREQKHRANRIMHATDGKVKSSAAETTEQSVGHWHFVLNPPRCAAQHALNHIGEKKRTPEYASLYMKGAE